MTEESADILCSDTTSAAPIGSTSSPKKKKKELKDVDPLLWSVTRNNDPNYDANAPTLSNIPILGSLVLDQSLFVVVPVALFSFLGIFTGIYVLITSSDEFAQAVSASLQELSIPPSTNTVVDPNACRGLCSSQEQDLEGLRTFMEGLRR